MDKVNCPNCHKDYLICNGTLPIREYMCHWYYDKYAKTSEITQFQGSDYLIFYSHVKDSFEVWLENNVLYKESGFPSMEHLKEIVSRIDSLQSFL